VVEPEVVAVVNVSVESDELPPHPTIKATRATKAATTPNLMLP
jgi:hypothetical protein